MSGSTAAAVMQIPCLGRPFQLGMLYNCHSEQLIPGKTLWGLDTLSTAVQKTPQLSSDFEVITEDSLSEKTSRLEVSGSLKLSLLGGLVSANGAGKYLNDRKSSKNQARVSLKYKTTSAFEQLTMEHLGQFEYPNVFDDGIATHVVTAVLYGADAFFVFDREVAKDEQYQEIHGNMELMIKKLPGIAEIGVGASADIQNKEGNEVEKFQCSFYGDFILPQNPSTFHDAVKIYQELPSLLGGEGFPNSVPKKVWLHPLSDLDSRGLRVVREISVGLVNDVEKLMENLHEFEMRCNDLIKADVCFHFLGIRNKLQKGKKLMSDYRLELVKSLGTLLPKIRGGGAEETELSKILQDNSQSAFSELCLSSWVSGVESEVKLLAGCLQKICKHKVQLAFAPTEMDVLINDIDVERFLCFDFNVAGRVDDHIQKMEAYLRKVPLQEVTTAIPWYKTRTLRLQLSLFIGFIQANADSSDMRYVVTDGSSEATTASSEVAVVSLYEIGLPTRFELPDMPGKPHAFNVTHNSLQLKWSAPKNGAKSVQSYTISYRSLDDPEDQYSGKATGVQLDHTLTGLAPKTVYFFKVRAETAAGISPESEISDPIETKTVRATGKIEPGCTKISKPGELPVIYQLPVYVAKGQESLAWCTVGKPVHSSTAVPHKVLMVVGATGAGKTTLINGIANYIRGVQWEDDYRFKLISDEGGQSQARSQTKCITSYTFHHTEDSPLPYTLTVIDTPGFGDTEGLERDRQLAKLIKEFFSLREAVGIDQLNGIGFVVQASLARLTPTQRYIFDAILSIFGKDIGSNIFLMTTFADGQTPPVLEAVKTADVPHQGHFRFNNSALFADKSAEDEFVRMFWKMGTQSFGEFFQAFAKVESKSLTLTREVLAEREQLETAIQGLQPQIHAGLSKIDELRQEEQILKQNEAEILTNEDFTYEVEVTKQRMVELPSGTYTTNCLKCNFTCHESCAYSDDTDKYRCSAMKRNRGTNQASCGVCPSQCSWREHKNNPYRFELYTEMETRTSTDLKARYESAISNKGQVETVITKMRKELDDMNEVVLYMINQAKSSIHRLEEIALRPNPLTEVQYIDLLIESEKQQGNPGFLKRIKALEQIRTQAELMSKLKGSEPVWQYESKQREQGKTKFQRLKSFFWPS